MCKREDFGDIVKVIKIKENSTDSLPCGTICNVFENYIPEGYKLLEKVEFEETLDETPPEIGFLETLKTIFGGKK